MVFLGCLFNRASESEYLKNSKVGLSGAANTFQWNLLDGFSENGEQVRILNALPVGTFPKQYKKLILKSRVWNNGKNHELGCVNLPFIKQHQRYLKAKKLLKKSQDKNILIYSAYAPFLKAAYKLNKSYNVTVVITDLPEYYDLGKTSKLKKFIRKLNNKKIEKYFKRIDKFVLLTEQMAKPLAVGNRPYVVVEGIASTSSDVKVCAPENKSILYTGTLHKQFGILTLLEAFSLIEDTDAELWICGGGDAKAEVEAAAKKDSRIKFFGYVTKETVNELQQKAFMLINPRKNEGEYTKYSFPSKTMEYMLSAKPVLMYKLDGIPSEYYQYLNFIEGNTADDMKNAILEIFSEPKKALEKAEKAAHFVSENKSSAVQAKKILNLME